MVLFKNSRDVTQVANLSRQMYPGRSKFLVEAFKDATAKPYGYLLIDLKPETDEKCRVRANIFPTMIVSMYTFRNKNGLCRLDCSHFDLSQS
jgi:hypothetical protein